MPVPQSHVPLKKADRNFCQSSAFPSCTSVNFESIAVFTRIGLFGNSPDLENQADTVNVI